MDDIHISVNYTEIILCDLIGRGSFWDVRKGIWRTNGQEKEVAVKTINGYFEENVLRKIQKQQKFIHQNIITLYGVIQNLSNICLIFEYADCGTLYNFLHHSDRDVSFNVKLNWMLQCAKGMEYLHNKNIIHRGLKTKSLLLFNEYSVLKISGLHTSSEVTTINTEIVGTLCMAPKVKTTNGDCNAKCDLYRYGIICWELMSEKKPFYELDNMHPSHIKTKINNGRRPNINDAKIHDESGCIGHIIEKCWDQVPENRPTMQEICVLLPMNPLANTNVDFKEIQLGELIGHGSYGIIHKAIWKLLGAENRSVAVQIIQNRSQNSVENIVQFEKDVYKEIQNLRKCIHRNIVTLYGASKDSSNNICLLLEYTDCGSLYDFLHHSLKEVSFNVKLDWMLQCATGLEFLHKNNTIHRDLKTKNLLLFNEYRTLKICDFGRVKEFANCSIDLIESVCYMAPEVYVNNENGKYNKMCDVFSFGIIFWEVLSRMNPYYEFNEMQPVDIKTKIINGIRPNINDANINDGSGYIKLIIEKCWDHTSENRPTMKELNDLLPILPLYPLDYQLENFEELQLVDVIGQGNYGVVHKAIWKHPNTKEMFIAVKMSKVVRSLTDKIKSAKYVFREMQNLKKCIHPNIVTLHGVTKDRDNQFCLLLEYADCGTLYNFLHNSDLDFEFTRKLDWMLQCATGIEFLQSKNIVHRDLKTPNLLFFNEYRTLKICDFGTGKELATCNTECIGTYSYMAPEICNESGIYDTKCDVFSFGIIFWEVMSRKKPFYEDGDMPMFAIQNKINLGRRPNINDANFHNDSRYIKQMIEKCWHQDPNKRPTMQELCALLRN